MDFSVSEQAVLSACLRDESSMSTSLAVERLTEDDFASPAHQSIFRLIAERGDVNEVDVAIELPQHSEEALVLAEKYGGGQVDRYVDQLVEARNRREVERAILISHDMLKQNKQSHEIASEFNAKVAKALASGRGQVKVGTATKEAHAEFLAIDAGDSSAVSTGFQRLDYCMSGGFQPGKLYVLAARPGVGKSGLSLHFSHEVAKRGYRASYASLEMSASECSSRLLSRESGVPRPRGKGDLLPAHRKKLEESTRRMQKWPINFKDDHKATLDSIGAFLAQERVKGEVGLAVIDYLQLVSAPGHDSRVQEITTISRTLKQISLELQIPILALSQLSRQSEINNRKPILSDLRDSGSIEQDADCVFLLSVDSKIDDTKDKINCHVAKNRGGETDLHVSLGFEKSTGNWTTSLGPSKPW